MRVDSVPPQRANATVAFVLEAGPRGQGNSASAESGLWARRKVKLYYSTDGSTISRPCQAASVVEASIEVVKQYAF
jgi:hypothetical protein